MASRLAIAAALLIGTTYAIRKRGCIGRKSKNRNLPPFKGCARLPTFATPSRYDIELRPDFNTFKFTGKSVVTLDISEDTCHLVLNVLDLSIKDSSVWFRCNKTREVLWPSHVHIEKDDEILVLTFDKDLPLGEAILCMEYQGNLNDNMKGFNRSSYMKDGEKKYMAVTQFEPADARRCFPCWDEPAFKANFKLTVHVPKDLVALSNMPVESETVYGATKSVSFESSPRMSTYLVAVVIGELEYLESETPSGNKVRVYCEVGKAEQGKFALDVAVKTLRFYEEYLETPYPLPKMDMVAIPDFVAGAMENYGLVTYRESALLYDEKHSAAENKQRVAVVVAHELAHQWFGNLVTMEWWTHLWLNEGFATWVSYLAVDHLFPAWKIWNQFIDTIVRAFKLDGLVETHPIEVDVGHAKEIDEIFDAISYNKGASIIRMLQTYLGAEVFQQGLVSYIKKYAYKNASTEDLWTSLSEASGEPVKELMDTWTKQKGYPVLTATIKDAALVVEQAQYLSSGAVGEGEWIVPITVCVGSYSSVTRKLMRGTTCNIELPTSNNGDTWVKLNVEQTSFYRVQYDSELASRLRAAVSSGSLDVKDRFGILDDMFALCSACKQPLSVLLSLLDAFKTETDYTVLGSLISISYKVLFIISDTIPEVVPYVKRFIASILQHAAGKLGWDSKDDGESHLDAMLRGDLLGALISVGNEETITEATRRFEVFMNDRETQLLPPDIRSAAFKAIMKQTTATERSGYDSLLCVYRECSLSQEKIRVLVNLASSPDPALVKEALNFSVSSEVRNQDTPFIFSGIGLEGRETAWQWLKEHWDFVFKNWGGFLITRFITATTSQFSSDEKAKDIQAFFDKHGDPAISRTVKQSVERVRINAQWAKHLRAEEGLIDTIRNLSQSTV